LIEHEPRWHASLAVLAAMLLYVTLPPRFTIGPAWVAPALVLVILVPLSILTPTRRRETKRMRFWSILLIAVVNFFNAVSVVLLVASFFHPEKATHASAAMLLRHGLQIWLTNVLVFGLWFWELDSDGPDVRVHATLRERLACADFLFPQMQMGIQSEAERELYEDWRPQFFDYLYAAFTTATAFSPTDTMPLSRRAKALMTAEALISLVTIAIVLARAVGLIQ
jgi:uncharacterized membrane protein